MMGTNIGFINGTNELYMDDEVQFDVTDRTELALCWFEFCKDEGIITYVNEVEVDDE